MAEEITSLIDEPAPAADQQEPSTEDQPVDQSQDAAADQQKPQQTPQSQDQQAPEGNPQWWKPDLFKLKYRGQSVSPRDYNHAKDLMQQGWSYKQAMSEVNRQKQDLEQTKSRYSQYETLDQAFKTNPAFAQKIWQMYQEAQQGGQQAQGSQTLDPQYQQLFQQFSGVQEKLKKWEESQADQEVNHEVQDLKAKFPTVQWDSVTESGHTLIWDVINHAYTTKFPSLLAAARDYLWDSMQSTATMQGAQQVAQARAKQVKAGVVGQGGKPGAPQTSSKSIKDMSYDDLTEMALKELKH